MTMKFKFFNTQLFITDEPRKYTHLDLITYDGIACLSLHLYKCHLQRVNSA